MVDDPFALFGTTKSPQTGGIGWACFREMCILRSAESEGSEQSAGRER